MKLLLFVLTTLFSLTNLNASHIDFVNSISKAKKQAKAEDKLIFIDFTADWCGPCKKMEANVFTDPEVADFFNENFVSVQLNDKNHKAIMKSYGVRAYPTLVFMTGDREFLYKAAGSMNKQGLMLLGQQMIELKNLKDEDYDVDTEAQLMDALGMTARWLHGDRFSDIAYNTVFYLPQFQESILENFGSYVVPDAKLEKHLKKNAPHLLDNKNIRDQLGIAYFLQKSAPKLTDVKDVCDKLSKIGFEAMDETKCYVSAFYAYNLNIFSNQQTAAAQKKNYGLNLILDYPECKDYNTQLQALNFLSSNDDKQVFCEKIISKYEGLDKEAWSYMNYHIYGTALNSINRNEEAMEAFEMAAELAVDAGADYRYK